MCRPDFLARAIEARLRRRILTGLAFDGDDLPAGSREIEDEVDLVLPFRSLRAVELGRRGVARRQDEGVDRIPVIRSRSPARRRSFRPVSRSLRSSSCANWWNAQRPKRPDCVIEMPRFDFDDDPLISLR